MIIERHDFKDLIERMIKSQKLQHDLYTLTKIDIYDTTVANNEGWFFDRLLDCIVIKEFRDIVSEYLFPYEDIECWERPESPLKIYNSIDDNIIDASIGTIDDLYNYLYANNGFCTNYRTSD